MFDVNPVIPTNQVLNTIDAGPPSSHVVALPPTVGRVFTVTWQGADDGGGSGIAAYDVFVSDNSGPFTVWQQQTTATSAAYTGQVGHSYQFYSLATDHVGHRQATPSTPTVTQVSANAWHNFANPCDVDGLSGVTALDALLLINYINAHPGDDSLPASPASPPPYYDVAGGANSEGDLEITPLDVLAVVNYINGHLTGLAEGEASPGVASPTSGPLAGNSGGIAANNLADIRLPAWYESRDRSRASRNIKAPEQASRRVATDRVLDSADDLCTPWEDLLPDLAADVDRAWRR